MGSPVNSIGRGVFVSAYLPTYSASRCLQGQRQRFKRQVGFGEEDQDSVPWLANERRASCCECGWRRLDIRDRDRLLLSSLPLVRTLCDHTKRLHLKDDEAGRNAWAILRRLDLPPQCQKLFRTMFGNHRAASPNRLWFLPHRNYARARAIRQSASRPRTRRSPCRSALRRPARSDQSAAVISSGETRDGQLWRVCRKLPSDFEPYGQRKWEGTQQDRPDCSGCCWFQPLLRAGVLALAVHATWIVHAHTQIIFMSMGGRRPM